VNAAPTLIPLSPTLARRLALTRQRLAGPQPPPTAAGLLETVRDLGCLQLDPTNAVARNHLLVPWSRVGPYDPADLETLRWQDQALFEYWAHAASLVLTEDYPIHNWLMRRYPSSNSVWAGRVRGWIETNHVLRDHILGSLRERGPLQSKDFTDLSVEPWQSTGWTGGRNVSRMLDFLWIEGRILVAGRKGAQKLWDLPERVLPTWTPREELADREVTRRAAQKAIRALGVATPAQIDFHYTRGRYPELESVLTELEAEGVIVRVQIAQDRRAWPGAWYLHRDDLPLLAGLEDGAWEPRTTLLSPFDNLICDRDRTELMFNFRFRLEIYVPKAQRQYGYFVMPILHGERLIGRLDPLLDRAQKRLTLHAVHAEPDAPLNDETARAITGAVERLATFVGAKEIVYPTDVPEGWRAALH
jgi:uncharacterized protein YcaQ